MADPLLDALRASLAEQTPVLVHLHGARIEGVVARLDETTVELRNGPARSIVRLSQIDAVTTS